MDCDILIPAAYENQLHEGNSSTVRARLIIEGTNGPTTIGAANILHEKGVFVVPDVLANDGCPINEILPYAVK